MSSKYHARKVYEYADGTVSVGVDLGKERKQIFDSVKEYERWLELKALERDGAITGLKRQVRYELIPTLHTFAGAPVRGVSYVADFVYTDRNGTFHVEDVKGMRTEVYKLKRKLMLYIKGIDIEEV